MVVPGLDTFVAVPAIGVDFAARFDRVVDERLQSLGGAIGNSAHPDPTNPAAHFFGRNHDQRFPSRSSARARRRARPRAFRRPRRVPRADRGPASPWRAAVCAATPTPSDSCRAPTPAAAPTRWCPVFVLVTHHMARNHRVNGVRVSWKIVPAVTDVCRPHAAHCQSTARTGHAFAPPQRGSENRPAIAAASRYAPTCRLGREASLEFGQRPRIILHGAGHYMLGSPESSRYPVFPICSVVAPGQPGAALWHLGQRLRTRDTVPSLPGRTRVERTAPRIPRRVGGSAAS